MSANIDDNSFIAGKARLDMMTEFVPRRAGKPRLHCPQNVHPKPGPMGAGRPLQTGNIILLLKRKIFGRLSVIAGNAVQVTGLLAAYVTLSLARSVHSKPVAIVAMIAAWILFYFFCHGIAHWAVGRILGIRFAFYTVGGTGNPTGYPTGMRWIFEHLPFFGVQTEKASMQQATPLAKAIMWSAGVTSSAVVPTLGAVCAWRAGVPGSKLFLIFAVIWAMATLSSNWRSKTGDFSKARRAISGQTKIN